jgi:hypothetical protein
LDQGKKKSHALLSIEIQHDILLFVILHNIDTNHEYEKNKIFGDIGFFLPVVKRAINHTNI